MNVDEASRITKIPPHTLRVWMRDIENPCPLGRAIKKSNNYTYIVNDKAVELWTKGIITDAHIADLLEG